jgi:hypothetical protein
MNDSRTDKALYMDTHFPPLHDGWATHRVVNGNYFMIQDTLLLHL